MPEDQFPRRERDGQAGRGGQGSGSSRGGSRPERGGGPARRGEGGRGAEGGRDPGPGRGGGRGAGGRRTAAVGLDAATGQGGHAPRGGRDRRPGHRELREERGGTRLTPKSPRLPEPAIPEGITGFELDRSVKNQLRTLSKENAVGVGQHLVMVAMLLDTDIVWAQAHAETAVRRAGRVPAAREALGLVAYRKGDWALGAERVPYGSTVVRLVAHVAADGRRRAWAGTYRAGARPRQLPGGPDAAPRRAGHRARHRGLGHPSGPRAERGGGRRPADP